MAINFIDEIEKEEENQSLSIPAKRLKDKLSPISSKVDEMTRRWFWELLQNASDYNDKVSVKLTIDNEKITFSHNGNPFKTIDVLNLISPDSGKDGDELGNKDNIGKFGSGLISTHILSSIINVEGIVRNANTEDYYKFSISLDRSKPEDKIFLQDSIKKSKQQLKDNFKNAEYKKGTFQTHFSYPLNAPYQGVDSTKVVNEGIEYITRILPYTLCFMRKVMSVEIINISDNFNGFSSYKISFTSEVNNTIAFNEIKDSESRTINMLYIKEGMASTAVEIKENQVATFPDKISKLFCGLPLIGTETIGLPIIVNSLEFLPSLERSGIELSPNDSINRKICVHAVTLYKKLIDILVDRKIGNLFNIAHIRNTVIGTEPSKIWFKSILIKSFIGILLDAKVLTNVNGENIALKTAKIPFAEKENLTPFFNVSQYLSNSKMPEASSFEAWFETIDFTLIPAVKYNFETFLSEVVKTTHVDTFVLFNKKNAIHWLKDILSLITCIDSNLLNKYTILPNQNKVLCSKESIFLNDNIPKELIDINNSINQEDIEDTFLHSDFNEFKAYLGDGKVRNLEFICNRIDDSFKKAYSKNDGNPDSFIEPLRKLFHWYNYSKLKSKDLKDLFTWFSGKRATLFLETFSEIERDMALGIAQSGKMSALSRLANSDLTVEQLSELANKAHLIEAILLALQEEIDDESFANEDTGNIGEQLVFDDLKKKFPEFQGYKVIWSSKENQEARFDFELLYKEETKFYIDAKTTVRGMANSDSIPFFMRKSQWNFLSTADAAEKYVIARVFLKDNSQKINYLSINLKELKK